MNNPVKKDTVWYAVEDSQTLERVVVISTIIFPTHGKYILYKLIDWPTLEPSPHPLCIHEELFTLLYTPQESPPCESQPTENFISKTSSQPRPFWSTVARKLWRRVPTKNNNYW